MAKCECCGEREANRHVFGDANEPLYGAAYAVECRGGDPAGREAMLARIRLRRAAQSECQHRFDQEQNRCLRCGLSEKAYEERETAQRNSEPPTVPTEQPRCQGCGAPIPTAGYCPYCEHTRVCSESKRRERTDAHPGNVAARARMAAADRKAMPRVTKDARELSKAHPWQADEGEP